MSDRHELQAAGTHPAPCARHCESTAYEIEIRRMRHDIEHHVRIATEATQEAEKLRAELATAKARVSELDAMLEHRSDEADDMERMLRAELAEGGEG